MLRVYSFKNCLKNYFQNPEEEEEVEDEVGNETLELRDVTRSFDFDADARSSDEETENTATDDVTNPDLPANPPQRSFSGSAMDLTLRLASNFKRKMSDQVRIPEFKLRDHYWLNY